MIDYNFTGKNILVVDTNFSSKYVVKLMLENTGASVDCLDDSTDAVLMLAKNKTLPDLVLMDTVQMPIMNGYEATRTIREFNADLPIIAYTDVPCDEEKLKKAGFNGYLQKFISKDLFINTIIKYLKD
jgi:CheY-like chemotaxis protein